MEPSRYSLCVSAGEFAPEELAAGQDNGDRTVHFRDNSSRRHAVHRRFTLLLRRGVNDRLGKN
jgi:hypothetical protein